jgi:hypothetical protein
MVDLFNNPSNDYIQPGLSPCPNVGDDQYLVWTENGLTVIKGSQEIGGIDFSDLAIPVTTFSTQQKLLGPGEVTFIQGLTKGLCNKAQGFKLPVLISTNEDNNSLFMIIDLSVNYYKNFGFTYSNVDASAVYSENINIADALNLTFDGKGIKITSSYDVSALNFSGTTPGYDFEISNVVLTIIDASENAASPFPHGANAPSYDLIEDPSMFIAPAKYQNTAMQGIALKGIYPAEFNNEYDKWIYINHVPDYVNICEPVEVDNFIYNIEAQKIITYDSSIVWGPFVDDLSIAAHEFTCVSTGITYDASYVYTPATDSEHIDNSVGYYAWYNDCSITNSILFYSILEDFMYTSNSETTDCSIYGSLLMDEEAIDPSFLNLSNLALSFVSDSSMYKIHTTQSFVQKTNISQCLFVESSIACVPSNYSYYVNVDFNDSSAFKDIFYSSTIYNSYVTDSSIVMISPLDASISVNRTLVIDSSLSNVYVNFANITNSDASLCYVINSQTQNVTFTHGHILDSSVKDSFINNTADVSTSVIEKSWTNVYVLATGDPSTPYEYIFDDPIVSDASVRVRIDFSIINDSSINNAIIYNSFVQDSSLIRCTIYNTLYDSSLVTIEDSTIIQINYEQDCSISWDTDSSTFYLKHHRKVEVGLSGCSVGESISAGDYLNWVTVNGFWKKVGEVYIWISSPDFDCCSEDPNLINGFYVFNPHENSVKIEYLVFV